MQLLVNLPGYEQLKVSLDSEGVIESYQLCCSSGTMGLFKKYLKDHGNQVSQWPLPNVNGDSKNALSLEERRAQLLIQELILKARGHWSLPYSGEIVCTCRAVTSETINDAITAKANTLEEVSNWTTASTSCTTCKDKVEEIIKYRNFKIAQ